MRSSGKLLKILNEIIGSLKPPVMNAEKLAKLDPEKIYVENVRALLGVSHSFAYRICETAVRQHVFDRRVEVLCPNGHVAASAATKDQLPDVVECPYESDGFIEFEERPTQSLQMVTYYRIHDQVEPSRSHTRTA